MVVKEYKKPAGVYNVQTFRTTQHELNIINYIVLKAHYTESIHEVNIRIAHEIKRVHLDGVPFPTFCNPSCGCSG